MSSQSLVLKIVGSVMAIAVLAACSPVSSPAPTVDIRPTLDAVRTEAASTVMAYCKLTTPTPTVADTATKTEVPTSTKTTVPTFMATNTLLPLWTKTPTQGSGGCTVTASSPAVNDVFAPNASFDGNWTVKNTGDGKWLTNEVDIRYATGTKFQTKVDVVDMKNDVGEGETYNVIVDMKAPAAPGTYATTWVIYKGGAVICSMPLTIKVQ
jgi:hypothetical protein